MADDLLKVVLGYHEVNFLGDIGIYAYSHPSTEVAVEMTWPEHIGKVIC